MRRLCLLALCLLYFNSIVSAQTCESFSVADFEDNTISIDVSGRVSGFTTPVLSIETPPANGITSLTGLVIDYTPNMDYSGIDTLDYRVEEQGNAAVFAVCQITIYITPREDAPRAMDDSFTVAEDSLNTPLSVTSNDFDVEGVGFSSVSIITPPNNGGVATAVGLIVEYSPAPNFNGGETFVYQVVDNNGRTDTATVFMTVTPAYDAFVAVDDFVTTFEDIPATIEVLANDQNIDNLPLLLSPGALMPTSGSISINPDNTITYTPDLHFVGRDTFEYDVNDGTNTDTGLVTIDMIPVTDGPVATDDMYMFAEDAGTQVLPVTSNDLNVDMASLYVSIVSSPNNGGLAVVNGLDIEYTSAANFNGIETFVYRLSDSAGQSDTATVTIDVTSVPDGIIANPDSTATVEDTAVDVYVLANDEDPDNDINDADIAIFMPPANGMVAVNNLMKFITYTPNANYFGTDTFQYEISNVDGDTAVATVTITIQSINDNITAVDDPNNMTDEDMATIIDVTSNDINNDGATLTVTISSPPSNGAAVVISGTPDTVQYTPNMDFNGVDSFEYTISTSLGATDSAVVTITVNPIDDPIQAFADDVTTWEDTPVRIDVLENDYEPDGDTITIAITMPPTNGAALVVTSPLARANGPDIMYTPDPDFVGTDTFEYSATDSGSGIPSLATVTVTIIAVNDPVVANDDSYTVAEDSVNTPFPVTLNDVDPDNDPGVFISIETQPTSGGTATVSGLDILYSPGTHFNGIDTFTYTFHDSFGSSDTATVTVTVTPAPDSVVAVDDSISTPEDTTVDIYVLDNDINIDGNPLTVTITTNPLSGTASVIPYGPGVAFIRYTPNAGYFGPDSLVYEISDTLSSSSATVSITVRSVDDGIFAVDDLATVDEDSTVPIDVTANDSNPDGGSLTVSISRAPLNGVVTVVGTMVNYQPHSDFNGQDSFEYTIRNAIGHTSSATVRVTVNPINDPILAVDDSASTHEDFPVVIYVLANDINVDRNQLFITGVTTPSSGTVTRNGNGTITYTPNLHFFGVDTFDYTITSVDLDQSTATVTVTVFSQSDPITAVDDFAGMSEDSGTITINVIVNDNNPDNLPLVVTVHTLPNRGGTATVVGQSIEYTPALNFNGEETFYYQIEANGMTDIALVTVTVAPSNDPPVAVADSATTREDVPVVISVLANDINVDNNPLTVAIVSAALNGDLSVNANNTITYTPNLNFNGADSFIYRIRDTTDGEFSDAMVTITITPVSDGLVAHDDYVATRPAASVVIDVLANDENIDNDPITVQIQVPPNEGTAVVNGNNTITFTASANFLGTDYFIYNITSTLDGDVDSAFVYINITAFICPCGTYLNSSSADCEPCPAGTSSIDGELCDACGPGFISGPGQCICTDCGPGMESDSTRTMCVPCPAGTYSEGSGACGLCPTNQISNIGAKECIPCPCGTQKVGLICEPCGDNLFSTEGEACHLCPPGHVATLGQCQCNDCGPGHEAVFDATLGRTICAPCQPGTFSPGTGQCARCPPGYATPFPGAIECYSCGCGLEPSANQDNCIECYPGFFSENSELCDICPPGTYANQTGQCQCTDCGPGYESNSNRTQCITCEPGFFSPGLGNCTRCKTGTISPRGSRDCAPCPCGQEASPDQSECVFCPPGQASTGNGNCDVCQPGFVTTIAGECECYPCDIGFQASSTQDRCEPCPPGTVNSRVGGICVTCDRGFISDQDGTRCIPCPCGTEYFNTTTCLICPEGTFSAGGKCDVCPPATYANSPGQCSCTHCGPGYHPNANRTTCEPCPAGTYSPAEAECIECPLGTISTEGSETCVSCGCGREPNDSKTDCAPCPPGTFSGDDQRCDRCPLGKISVLEGQCSCADCPPGYQSDPTRTVCQPCPAGTFSIGGSGCVQCELGSYSLEGSGSCSPCDCGKAPNPTRSDCDLCPVGEFSSHGVACSSCPLGTISSSPGFCSCLDCGAGSQAVNSTRCELCAPGTYSPGAGQCLPCPTGTVSLSFGAEACVPCACGTTPNSNRTLCDACPPGSFSNAGGTCQTCPPGAVAVNDGACECDECGAGMGADATRTVCVLCDPGFYSPGDGECQRCPRGTVAPGPGSDSCDECNCGHQPNSGASNCEMCPPGTFSTPGGLCQDCPRNQVSNSGACHCESCGLGYQANEPQNFCSLCPAGTFSPNDGQCQVCPTGTFSTAGAANCSVCPPGHTPNAGFRATGCSQCPAGTYSSDGVACYSCPQGTVTTVAGQSSCTPCGCGYEAATTVCVPCAAGEFSTPDGNCQACPTGSASTSEASCSCDRCPPGTEASADRTTCNVCNPGTYSEAGEACQRCQPGSAASDFGSSRCEPCPIGHGDTTVASICGQCPAGFSSGVGETCSPCLPGQISVIGGPCQDCPAGYGNIDVRFRDVCGPCPAGSSSEVGGECVRCKEGQIARSGEICRPCDPGHEPNFQQSECVSCPQGTFSRNGEPCIPCLQGTISNGPGAIECTICPAGFTSNSARTLCIPCQAGYSSVPGGVCVECQGGSTSKSGALCEPCAPGNGDTHTLPGTCLPCEYGHSSELGGICVKCPVGQEAFPGGLCTDCPAGFGADVGGLCGPCPEGQSSSPGGACTDCLPGYYSYSGGLCHPCPAGYSSSGGSSECRQCEYGQFSLSGGQCVDRCPAGQAWSYIFQQCAICPKDTFSEAGDTSCTECPDGRYAPEESPSCWSSGRIGGRMRITQSFDSFYLPDWVHCVAVLLDSEARDIVVWNAYRDPTIIDFEIKDPTMSTLATESTPIRRLSGNEKMLLFYQWWLTGDERIADFDYDIIDFKAFTETVGDGNSADVVQLFVSSAPIYYEFGPKPDTYDPNSINSGFYFDKTTLKVTISVDNSNNLAPSLLLITLLMLLFIIMFI